jgi:iron(II)-dependent oxidoreductase
VPALDPGTAALAPRIADRLDAVRTRTLRLVEPLDDAALAVRPDPIMSPPVWDLGHIAAYEELWIARRLGGHEALHPELDALYDAFETPRARRADLPILGPAEVVGYLDAVRERTLEVLGRADLAADGPPLTADGFLFDMIAQHEAQHTETLLQALQMLPAGSYAAPRAVELPPGERGGDAVLPVPGSVFDMGAGPRGFAYDCERPRHRRTLRPFRIARHPVTNGAHLAFMADGGYRRRDVWSAEGWDWRERAGVEAPLYWQRDGEGGWLTRAFDRVAPVDPARPLSHVSWYEADAHARWAGARLPTEAEWERAAAWDPDAGKARPRPWGADDWTGRANLDQLAFSTAPVGAYAGGAAACGAAGMLGDVWEWTSTAFEGYPGFRAFPYAEYAEVFFGDRYRVLRGGSWATQPIAARTSFRNWDLPERRQIFAGLRLAWDA